MTIDTLDTLSTLIEEKLLEAERQGLEREAVADRLEEHAAAVRNGHATLPENRGEWWDDAHGDETADSGRVPARSD